MGKLDYRSDRGITGGGRTLREKEAFCEKVQQHERAMYALAYAMVRNEQDAGDVVSESVLRAFRNLSTLRNDRSFKPWILRIVHNTAVELIRKNARLVELDDEEEIEADSGGSDLATRLALRDAVERLKQPYRTVVILYYYEGLPASKIAQITGDSVGAVRQQLSRARKQMRERLKEDFLNE